MQGKGWSMNEKCKVPSTRFEARRRLVRGAFGAPAALTLFSGGAFAAGSNLRCVVNQVNTPYLALPSGTTDTWVRVQLWTLGTGGNLSTWVSGADIVALTNANTPAPYLTTSQWQCFTAGSGSGYTVGQLLATPPSKPGSTLAHNGSYVAVRVDGTGKIIGVVGVEGSSGSSIAQTCWTSFIAAVG